MSEILVYIPKCDLILPPVVIFITLVIKLYLLFRPKLVVTFITLVTLLTIQTYISSDLYYAGYSTYYSDLHK